jgi:hypothetical protein
LRAARTVLEECLLNRKAGEAGKKECEAGSRALASIFPAFPDFLFKSGI